MSRRSGLPRVAKQKVLEFFFHGTPETQAVALRTIDPRLDSSCCGVLKSSWHGEGRSIIQVKIAYFACNRNSSHFSYFRHSGAFGEQLEQPCRTVLQSSRQQRVPAAMSTCNHRNDGNEVAVYTLPSLSVSSLEKLFQLLFGCLVQCGNARLAPRPFSKYFLE